MRLKNWQIRSTLGFQAVMGPLTACPGLFCPFWPVPSCSGLFCPFWRPSGVLAVMVGPGGRGRRLFAVRAIVTVKSSYQRSGRYATWGLHAQPGPRAAIAALGRARTVSPGTRERGGGPASSVETLREGPDSTHGVPHPALNGVPRPRGPHILPEKGPATSGPFRPPTLTHGDPPAPCQFPGPAIAGPGNPRCVGGAGAPSPLVNKAGLG